MKKSIHICMVSDDFLPAATGVGIHLMLITRELASRGYQVSVLTCKKPGDSAFEIWEDVQIHRVPSLKIFGFYQGIPSNKFISNFLEAKCVKIVHHHYHSMMKYKTQKIAKNKNIPQLSTYHFEPDLLFTPVLLRPFKPVIEKLVRYIENRNQMIIVPSMNLLKKLEKSGITVPMQYISNPILFKEEKKGLPAIDKTGFIVLYVGRLAVEKNIGLLLKAFQRLVKDKPSASLWIVGTGPQTTQLINEARALGITKSVVFWGQIDHNNLSQIYAECDIFVLPSIKETQSMVAIEAMSFYKPIIITSAIISANELVENEKNGFIVDSNSSEEMASKMKILADNPILLKNMGEAAYKKVANFGLEKIVDLLEETYLKLLSK